MTYAPEIQALLNALSGARSAVSELSPAKLSALRTLIADPDHGAEISDVIIQTLGEIQGLAEITGASERNFTQKQENNVSRVQHSGLSIGEASSIERNQQSTKKKTSARRQPSKAYDYLIYFGIKQGRRSRPVGQQDIFELLSELDGLTKRSSLTSKLNRMKDEGKLHWVRPDEMGLGEFGNEEMDRLHQHLDAKARDKIKQAFQTAWNMDVEVR